MVLWDFQQDRNAHFYVFCWKNSHRGEKGRGVFNLEAKIVGKFGNRLWKYEKQTGKCSLCSLGIERGKRLKEQLETFDFTQAKLCNSKDRWAGD